VPQPLPSDSVDHADALFPGWHDWQASLGFVIPDAYMTPPITHRVPHCPAEQTCPPPQLFPSITLVQALVLMPGVHTWQASLGSIALAA
jgi:hypothetical protein